MVIVRASRLSFPCIDLFSEIYMVITQKPDPKKYARHSQPLLNADLNTLCVTLAYEWCIFTALPCKWPMEMYMHLDAPAITTISATSLCCHLLEQQTHIFQTLHTSQVCELQYLQPTCSSSTDLSNFWLNWDIISFTCRGFYFLF